MAYPPAIYKTYADGDSFGAVDLNALQSLLGQTNLTPDSINDASATVLSMQTTADPFPGGSESLATTLQEELTRLRFMFKKLFGLSQWYKYNDEQKVGAQEASGTNTAGANLHVAAGKGTGSGSGGNMFIDIAYPGSSGTSLNTYSPLITLTGNNKQSSGTTDLVNINPVVNQSGTASYSGVRINVTETATGSGPHHILTLGSSTFGDMFAFDPNGSFAIVASATSEIYFGDNGQIRSHDDNHRIMFFRASNELELREQGKIILSAGSTAGRTGTVIINGPTLPTSPPSGTKAGTLCIDTAGNMYVEP